MRKLIDIEALKDFINEEREKASELYHYHDAFKNNLDKAYYEGYRNAFYSMSDFLKELEDATED